MKKNILILLSLITFTAMAQTKGKFEVLDLKDFKLHVYYTNDALNDASVEGKNGLITLEQPLFKDNVAEFDAYVAKCKELALFDTSVTATYGDKLITLSTCDHDLENGRLVVVAKRMTE